MNPIVNILSFRESKIRGFKLMTPTANDEGVKGTTRERTRKRGRRREEERGRGRVGEEEVERKREGRRGKKGEGEEEREKGREGESSASTQHP